MTFVLELCTIQWNKPKRRKDFNNLLSVVVGNMARKKTTKDVRAKSSSSMKKRTNDSASESLSKKFKATKDEKVSGDKQSTFKCTGYQRKASHGSILHYIYKSSLGQNIHSHLRQCLQQPFVRSLASYGLHSTASPFDRRVTCLEWHPTHPTTLAVGSKGGDIILWDYQGPNKMSFLQGDGAGDSITDMKFNPCNATQLFLSSIGGTTTLRDFNGTVLQVFVNTESWDYWYCCVDVSISRQMLATGDNTGRLVLQGLDGHKIFDDKLHKAKVTHAEFNSRCDWLLATASVDSTVKLWDLRNLKGKKSFLHEMQHNKPVNSGEYSS